MLIDMHNHTLVSSPDSTLQPEELIELARIRGLDGICVTEHSFIEGAEVTREWGVKLRFPVFRGIEARSDLGDMLVFGYYRDVPDGIPFQELASLVHEAGGVVFAAHPFRPEGFTLHSSLRNLGLSLDQQGQTIGTLDPLDGIEVANGKNSREGNERACLLSHRLGVPGIGGSDAHEPEDVGRSVTRFTQLIRSESDLLAALRNGDCEPLQLLRHFGNPVDQPEAPQTSSAILSMRWGGNRHSTHLDECRHERPGMVQGQSGA